MEGERRTLEECLIEAGFWSKEDGAFSGDEQSLGIVYDRMLEGLARGVRMMFLNFDQGNPGREVSVICGHQRHTLAIGNGFSDALCNAALALPDFLKVHPEYAK